MVHKGLMTSGYRLGEARSELDVADTSAAPANGHDVTPTGPQTAPPASQSERKPRRRHLVLDVSIIAGVIVVYLLSLLGSHWLASAPGPLADPDVGTCRRHRGFGALRAAAPR